MNRPAQKDSVRVGIGFFEIDRSNPVQHSMREGGGRVRR